MVVMVMGREEGRGSLLIIIMYVWVYECVLCWNAGGRGGGGGWRGEEKERDGTNYTIAIRD